MKKIISILLILTLILSFVGCSNTSTEEQIVYDGKKAMDSFVPAKGTISINAYNNDYIISINEMERTYFVVPEDGNENSNSNLELTNFQEITNSNTLEMIASSKQLIINYINESLVLTDKEDLTSYITNLPFKSADFPNDSLIAGFNQELDTIFLNMESNLLDEHTIVHELFHALAHKTRSNSIWNTSNATILDEAFTEMLASSISNSNYPTAYDNYIPYVYYFIGSHGLDAIKSYFYGESELNVPTIEFELYALSLSFLQEALTQEEAESEKMTLHFILSKWGLEK